MNNNPQNRKLIVRCCKARGWTVQPLALQCIDDYLANDDSDTDRTTAVQRVIDMISPVMLKQISKRTITHGIVMEALIKQSNDKLPQQKSLRNKSSSDRAHEISRERKTKVVSTATDFYLVSAFDIPRLSYDETRRQFNVEEQPWPLLGAAEDKVRRYLGKMAEKRHYYLSNCPNSPYLDTDYYVYTTLYTYTSKNITSSAFPTSDPIEHIQQSCFE
jgi:hypothetical protein